MQIIAPVDSGILNVLFTYIYFIYFLIVLTQKKTLSKSEKKNYVFKKKYINCILYHIFMKLISLSV